MENIKSKIRTIPDFPKKGIMFRDITTLLKDPNAFRQVIDCFVDRYEGKNIDKILAIESRGFIIGGALADRLGKSFIPARKPGKLPSKTVKAEYELEYGKDALEIHEDAINPGDKVLIIDDLLATSGTARAAIDLVKKLDGNVVECAFIVELVDLKGREKIESKNVPVFSLVEFEGE